VQSKIWSIATSLRSETW